MDDADQGHLGVLRAAYPRLPRRPCACSAPIMPAITRPSPCARRWRSSSISRSSTRATRGSRWVPRMCASSMMHYFDSKEMELSPSHIMASGALPPAFPAVRIDGELYWDGGILSNTPTERIFDDTPRRNSLIFAVHLWHPTGEEPETIWQILNRSKDIQYSSRIANHIVRQRETHKLRHVITNLLRVRSRGREERSALPGACRLSLRHAHACGAAAERRASTTRPTPRTSTFRPRASATRWEAGLCRHHARARSNSPGSASGVRSMA